jgi:hypothetical protein
MDNNNIAGIKGYYYLLQQITSLLNLSLPEIRQKYINYPYCLIDYFEKNVEEKGIWSRSFRFCVVSDTASSDFTENASGRRVWSLGKCGRSCR